MRGAGAETNLVLTRKESHLVLEMLAKKAREAQWLSEAVWLQVDRMNLLEA